MHRKADGSNYTMITLQYKGGYVYSVGEGADRGIGYRGEQFSSMFTNFF